MLAINSSLYAIFLKIGSIELNSNAFHQQLSRLLQLVVFSTTMILSGTGPSLAFDLPENFENQVIINNLNDPDYFAFSPDGRIFISERITGNLLVAKFNTGTGLWSINATPFHTFDTPKPDARRSAGLRSIAFDPNFTTNGYIYIFYMKDNVLQNRVVRIKADASNPNISDLNFGVGGEQLLIELPFNSTFASGSHNGGALQFGGDGKLYITTGDGWDGEFAGDPVQSLSTFTGKVLRLNSDGTIPTDNPFYNQTTGDYQAIYALGLRNPYSMSRHPTTDLLYINEARGTAKATIYIVEPSANYGHEDSGEGIGMISTPWANSSNGTSAQLITGGAWYPQSGSFPSNYFGGYFTAMWGGNNETTGKINLISSNTNTSVSVFEDNVGNFGSNGLPVKPVITQIGPDSNLYYLLTTYTTSSGVIHRVRFTTQGTVAAPTISPQGGNFDNPQTVTLTSDTSSADIRYTLNGSEPTGASTLYSGDFVVSSNTIIKAKAFKSGLNPSSTTAANFMFDDGSINQLPIIDAGADKTVLVGDSVALDGSASTDPDGDDDLMYDENWTQLSGPIVEIFDASEEIAFFNPSESGVYKFRLEMKDQLGASGSDTVIITVQQPDNIPPSVPTELKLNSVTTTAVNFSWISSTDTQGTVALYHIMRDGSEIDTSTVASYTDNTVVADTAYVYNVTAEDNAGNESTISANLNVDTTVPSGPALLAGYAFEEGTGQTVLDLSGNGNNGTLGGNAIRNLTGQPGESIEFSGSTSHINLGAMDITTPTMSIALWFKPDDFGTHDARLISKANGTASSSHYWMISTRRSSGQKKLRFRLKTDNGGTSTLIGSAALIVGQWTHVAATYDGTVMKLYQDGIEVGSLAKTGTIATSTSVEAWIGANPGNTRYFDGLIDDVRIYGEALDLATIQDIISGNFPLTSNNDDEAPTQPSNLTAQPTSTLLDLNWDAATDNVGVALYRISLDGTEVGTATGTSFQETGLNPDQTYSFSVIAEDANGNQSTPATVSVTTLPADTKAPSVPTGLIEDSATASSVAISWLASTDTQGIVTSYRIFRDSIEVGISTTISFTDTTVQADQPYQYSVSAIDDAGNKSSSSATLQVITPTLPDTEAPSVPTGLILDSVTENQVAISWVASTDTQGTVASYRIFRDNVEVGISVTTSFTDSTVQGGQTYLYSVSSIDDTGNESNQSATLSVDTPSAPDNEAPSIPAGLTLSSVTATAVSFSWTPSTDTQGTVALYHIFRDGSEIDTSTVASYTDNTVVADTAYVYNVTAEDNAGNESTISANLNVDTTVPSGPALLAGYAFEEGTGQTVLDLSGNGNNGTLGGNAIRNLTGQPGESIEFSGSTSHINLGAMDITTPTMSIALWFKPDDFGTHDARLISKANGTASSSHYWMISTRRSSGQKKLRFRLKTDNGGTSTLIGSAALIVGQWTHVAATYDGTVMKLYQDGIEVGSLAKTGTIATSTSVEAWIGANPGNTRYFDGLIDDVRIYGEALDLATIQDIISGIFPLTSNNDDEAPTQPSNLTAQPTSTLLDLNWDAATDNVGVALYRISLDGTEVGTATGTSFQETGLNPDQTYSFSVIAEDANGNQSTPATVSVTTLPADTKAPSVPTGLIEDSATASSVAISWLASTDTQGIVTSYRIFRDSIEVGISTTISFTDTTVQADQPYQYSVSAIDDAGNKSSSSATLQVITPTLPDTEAPSVPTGLILDSVTENQVAISWVASTDTQGTVASYRIFRDNVEVGISVTTSFTDSTVQGGQTYLYSVSSIDDTGNESNQSATLSVDTPSAPDNEAPSIPAGLTLSSVTATAVSFSWTPSTDTQGTVALYHIFRDGSEIDTSTVASYTDNTVVADTAYVYNVTAEDNAGNESTISANLNVDTTVPSGPALLAGYAFEEGTGQTVLDLSGNGNNGTLGGNAIRNLTGQPGESIEFSGSTSHINLGAMDITTPTMSIALWFKPDDFGTHDARLISKANGTASSSHYWMISTRRSSGQKKLRFRLKTDNGGTSTLIGSAALIVGQWTHVAATYDGTVMKLYQDGIEVGSLAKTGTIATSTSVEAWVGANPGNTRYFDGLIDDVRIYGEALDVTTIQDIISGNLPL